MTDKFLYLTEYTDRGVIGGLREREISIRVSNIIDFEKCVDEDSKIRTKILLNYSRDITTLAINSSILVTQEYEKVRQLIESGD